MNRRTEIRAAVKKNQAADHHRAGPDEKIRASCPMTTPSNRLPAAWNKTAIADTSCTSVSDTAPFNCAFAAPLCGNTLSEGPSNDRSPPIKKASKVSAFHQCGEFRRGFLPAGGVIRHGKALRKIFTYCNYRGTTVRRSAPSFFQGPRPHARRSGMCSIVRWHWRILQTK